MICQCGRFIVMGRVQLSHSTAQPKMISPNAAPSSRRFRVCFCSTFRGWMPSTSRRRRHACFSAHQTHMSLVQKLRDTVILGNMECSPEASLRRLRR
ncbi:hypothetical protein FGO68_gene10901 [Halteria grandinella]|uniref:Uncharacterized protein n=1 Tax=Halteria grandinella TaxID=5974 RepID=A0A8J8SUV1_HALGN|nr:hypothetical protein FGO68_gene10901 [Halteria grandinella]